MNERTLVPNSFLASARQGNNGLVRYCLCILLSWGFTYGVMLIVMLAISIAMRMMGIGTHLQENIDAVLDKPFALWIYEIFAYSLMLLGFWLVFRKVHRRSLLTLIRADQTICWAQVRKGALVWFGLALLSIGALSLLDPGRYKVVFIAENWLRFLFPTLIAIPSKTLLFGIIYAYPLQGLGLLIRKPARLAIAFAVIAGLFSQLGQPFSIASLVISICTVYFLVLVVLKNQGLEFLLGLFISSNGLELLMLGSPDDSPVLPTMLQRVDAAPDLTGKVTLLLTMALFYGICFGLPWQRRVSEHDSHG